MTKIRAAFNTRGLTLIELLVAFVISTLIIGAIYRVFTAQNKAYVVQDQVTEVQQGIKGAMDILLRDLRMAGYDNNSSNSLIGIPREDSLVKINDPIIAGDNAISIIYEYDNTTLNTVTYRLNGNILERQITTTNNLNVSIAGNWVAILENVDAFNLTYGVDADDDGSMDMEAGWVNASYLYITKTVGGAPVTHMVVKPVAVHVTLTARPDQMNEDVKKWVSPRTMTTIANLKNKTLVKLSL